ncbi:MAG: hypothetical protein AAF430_18425 [Myxococcota bacterium]
MSQVNSSSHSDDSYQQSQDVFGGGSPVQLAAHYRPKLEAQGWKFVEQSLLEHIASLVLSKPDRSGRAWNLHLVAIQVGSGVKLLLELHLQESQ